MPILWTLFTLLGCNVHANQFQMYLHTNQAGKLGGTGGQPLCSEYRELNGRPGSKRAWTQLGQCQ
jgi:hypothetical protein